MNSSSFSRSDLSNRRSSAPGNGANNTNRSSSNGNNSRRSSQDRYHYASDEPATSYVNLAKSTVLTANSLIHEIEGDTHSKDSKEIVKKRNAMNQNLEELISLVMQENEAYKSEVYRLRDEILSLHELLRHREHELLSSAEQTNLVSDGELTRVLAEHSDIVKQSKIYQKECREAKEYSHRLEEHMHVCVDEAMKFKSTISNLEVETKALKQKLDEVGKNNRVMELAYEEVIQYRRERIVREIAYPTNHDEEIAKLRAELFSTNEKVKELENENTFIKAQQLEKSTIIDNKDLEYKKLEKEREAAIEEAAKKLQDMELKKKQAEESMLQADLARKEADKLRVIAEEKARNLALVVPVKDEDPTIKKHPIALKAEKRASITLQVDDRLASPRNSILSIPGLPVSPKLARANTAPAANTPGSPTSVLLQQIAAKAGKEVPPVKEDVEVDFLELSMNDISSYF